MRDDIRGVLFDLDGLLIDSESVGIRVLLEESSALGTPVAESFLKTLLGATRERIRSLYAEKYPQVDFDRLYDVFALRMAEEARAGRIPLKKGAARLMHALQEKGIPHCVASSSPARSIRVYLEAEGLLRDAPVYISSEEVSRSKPFPDVFLKAAERIGCPIGQCLILEDSLNGLRAGRASGAVVGMVPDIIPWSAEAAPFCDAVFKDLDEVLEWLKI